MPIFDPILYSVFKYSNHVTSIFPEDTDETVTVVSGSEPNVPCDWTEIKDNFNVTFSSKFANRDGFITSIIVEDASTKDILYELEVAYGDAKTIVARSRFMKLNIKVNVEHQRRIRSRYVPKGETLYYCLRAEQALETAVIQFRYYLV